VGKRVVGQMVGAMKVMYIISLIGIVIMNSLLYNEYIIIRLFKKVFLWDIVSTDDQASRPKPEEGVSLHLALSEEVAVLLEGFLFSITQGGPRATRYMDRDMDSCILMGLVRSHKESSICKLIDF
jgi:hypothetical protein